MERRRLPSLNSLKSFEAVARSGSFTIAADELCVTQGAVSHQVKALETQLGLRLFEKDRSKVTLTPAGEVLLRATNAALNKVAVAIDKISKDVALLRKTIYIQASSQFAQFWLAPRIKEFAQCEPNIRIYVGQSAPETSCTSDSEFVSVMPDHAMAIDDEKELVFRSDLIPMCSISLTENIDRVQTRDVPQNGFLLCERHHDWWNDWIEISKPGSDFGDGRLYFEDSSLAVHTALAGQGWMLGSQVVLDGLITAGQLVCPLDPKNSLPRAYFLRTGTTSGKTSLARKFRSWLFDVTSSQRA